MVSFLLPLALYNLSSQNSRVTTLKYKSKLLLYSKPSKGCHFTLSENQSPCNGLQGAVIYASIPLKSHLSLPLLIDFISPIPESLMLLQIQEFFCLNACAHSVPRTELEHISSRCVYYSLPHFFQVYFQMTHYQWSLPLTTLHKLATLHHHGLSLVCLFFLTLT